MSDEAAFLSAIVSNPMEDAHRLVFADWLDEHDDFRGEFVRAAVAYDRTPPYDATRFQLGERLRNLLESLPFKKWLPAEPVFGWGWRRGLLTLIADTMMLETSPANIARWLASDWIDRVEFGTSVFGSQPRWESTFDRVRNVREAHFKTDNWGPDVLTRLREWPHLRGLSISYLMEPWANLAALPHLRALTLDNPDWTMMPELHAARLPNLEVLNLDKEWNDELPSWNTCFPKLRSLTLTHYNTYPDEQCERFAVCPQLQHLALYQRYHPLKAVGLKALAKAKELRSLTIGPWPRGTIEGLAKLAKLERLEGYGQVKTIRGLEALTGLRWLSVDTGTKSVVTQAIKLPHLTRLDLCSDAIEAGAIASLAKAKSLRVLTVSADETPIPASELARVENLQYLRISPPGLAPEDILSLQKALPDCQIVNNSHGTHNDDEYDWS